MFPSCANKRAAYRHANHQRALRTTCWKGVLEFVQHSGCLDVPGAAACALARGKNEGGVPFVFDPHDITLHDDLWHAAFAGNVDIVTASVGPQHRNAVDELIGDVLDTGAMLTGGNVARVACAGTGTPQGNMAAWNTSDLDIMLSVPWNTSDLDTMLAFDHQIHGVEHAIKIFARKVKQHWRLHSESHPFTGNFVYNKMHNSVKHCRSAQFETTEKGSCRRWKIDIITPTIGALDALSCFDINVCRVGLCRRALHYVGMTAQEMPVPFGALGDANGGAPMVLRATHASCLDTSMSTTNACTLVNRLYKYVRRGFELCPLSVVKSLCYYQPPPTSTCVCIVIDCPFACDQRLDTISQSIATFARSHPNVSSFAIARHERNARNMARLRKAIEAATARCAGLTLNPAQAHARVRLIGNDIVTAWMQLSPSHEKPSGYNFARDKINIEGNQLVTEFTQTGGTCEIDTPHNSDIAWSDSFKIRKHQRTMEWLTKCLEATPINHHNGHLAAGNGSGNGADNSSNSDSDASDASEEGNLGNIGGVWLSGALRSRTFKHHLVQSIKNTIDSHLLGPDTGATKKAIWMEATATMRHIRLALEDNCSSCIRHPNLTTGGGTHSFTPPMQTDFAECCL